MEQQPSVEICVSEAEPMRRGDDDPRCGTVLSLFSWFNSRRCSVCQFRGTCLLLGQNSNLFQNGFSEVSERAVGFGLQEESNTKCSWQVLRACWSLVARTCYLWKWVDILWNCQQGYPVLEVFCLTGPHESWAQEATAEATGQEPSFFGKDAIWCNAMDIGPWFLVRSFFVWDCWHFGAWTLERWLGHRSFSRLSEVMFIEQQKFEKASSQV